MSKKIQLTIPKPCHEDWDKMTPVEKGKFCGSCQKQVVDFSVMSDRQVAAFFRKPSTGSVCGRFMTDQLDREIEVPKKRIPWLKYFFQIALPAFFVSKLSAQTHKTGKVAHTGGAPVTVTATTGKPVVKNIAENTPVCVQRAEDTLPPLLPMMGAVAYVEERGQKGMVVDAETGLPVSGVYMEMNTSSGNEMVAVNPDGSFLLSIYRKIKVNYIEVSGPGYKTQQIRYKDLKKAADGTVLVKLKRETNLMLKGEIAVNDCRRPLMGDTMVTDLPAAVAIDKIKGVVVNENKESIPYASIQAGRGMNFFVADENGAFEIKTSQLTGEKVLLVSAAGYENTSVKVEERFLRGEELPVVLRAKNTLPEIVIPSALVKGQIKTVYTTGFVSSVPGTTLSVNEPLINKETPLPAIGKRELTVYPNPLPAGTTLNLNLSLKKGEEGYYQLQLINQSGQAVFERQVWIDGEARVFSIEPPFIPAGTYIVLLISRETGKKLTDRIVVQ
ncbi:MAG: carboxypeptidase-like regulatory domain-containing protein [Chitinophagaceae bacterium]